MRIYGSAVAFKANRGGPVGGEVHALREPVNLRADGLSFDADDAVSGF
jgi:hypothetical protein